MFKKTIQINPELFKISKKTRKNTEKKDLGLMVKPIISSNTLKNKLLNRIREHKIQEFKDIKEKEKVKAKAKKDIVPIIDDSISTDEFDGAINFLSKLKRNKQKEKEQLIHNKTLKSISNSFNSSNSNALDILLDLPEELELEKVKSNSFEFDTNKSDTNKSDTSDVFLINHDVPYGCLKNGKKTTYREWKKINQEIELPDIIRPPTPPKKSLEAREAKLEQIKLKLKKQQEQDNPKLKHLIDDFKSFEDKLTYKLDDLDSKDDSKDDFGYKVDDEDDDELFKDTDSQKKYIKKTIKRTFTLGKNEKLRKISILVKNKQTRKNIINTQKELKKININDVKKYLRQHGIAKIGSTCPNDILRKTFECSLLSGEINNTNKDVLLHNYLHSS